METEQRKRQRPILKPWNLNIRVTAKFWHDLDKLSMEKNMSKTAIIEAAFYMYKEAQ